MSQATQEINRQLSGMLKARLEFAGISTSQVQTMMRVGHCGPETAAKRLLEKAAKVEERPS